MSRKVPRSSIPALLIGCAFLLLEGCGQVSVFGHTIGERQESSKAQADKSAPSQAQRESQAAPTNPAVQPSEARKDAPTISATSSKPTSEATGAETAQSKTLPLKIKSVSVALTADVAAKAGKDPHFSTDALAQAVKSELQSRGILVASDSPAVAEIVIDGFALHPTSNAIIFGQIISNGVLNGALHVRDAQGRDIGSHRIEAKTRVSFPAKGAAKDPLGPLNRQFAIQAGDALTGVATRAESTDEWRPR